MTQASDWPAALASCHALPTAATVAMSHAAPPRNGSTPTVLLVHGAFTDSSMWAGVITELQAAGPLFIPASYQVHCTFTTQAW